MSQTSKNWKTSSQQYGSHYGKSGSQPKPKIGKTTLGFLVNGDKGNFISQQQNIAQKYRLGLFSQPMGLSPGDIYQDKKPDRPEKRVEVNQRLQQKVGPQLFSKLGSTNIADPYKDPFRAQQLYLKEKNQMTIHGGAFMAGGKQKLVKNSEFEHFKDYQDKMYDTRDEFGKVRTGLKQITTANMKKGFGSTTTGHLFGDYPYIGSEFDSQKNLESKQRMEHKAKIKQPFRGHSNPGKTFTPDYVVHQPGDPYSTTKDDQLHRGRPRPEANGWKYNNPGKKGFNGTFTQFPQYIEEGEKQKKHPQEVKPWIPNFVGTSKNFNQTLAKPCPAPSQLLINELRRK